MSEDPAMSGIDSILSNIQAKTYYDFETGTLSDDSSYFEYDHETEGKHSQTKPPEAVVEPVKADVVTGEENLAPSGNKSRRRERQVATKPRRSPRLRGNTPTSSVVNASLRAIKSTGGKTKPLARSCSPSIKKPRFFSPHRQHLKELTNSPKTPNVLKRGLMLREAAKNKLKTSQQIEEERIQEEKHRMKKLRQLTKESYNKLKNPKPLVPVRVLRNTKPEEFHFATDTRIKDTKPLQEDSVNNFVSELRKDSTAKIWKLPEGGRTIPKPFKLTETKKRKHEEAETFQSLAEGVLKFETSPRRTRSNSRSNSRTDDVHGKALTIAKTPMLQAKRRVRNVAVLSHQQQEEQEIEQMKKLQFKAHPVNERILRNPVKLGAKVAKKESTEIKPFHLTQMKKRQVVENTEEFKFHANPVPQHVIKGVPPPVKEKKFTVPESPAFALKTRMITRQMKQENKSQDEFKVLLPVLRKEPKSENKSKDLAKLESKKFPTLPIPFSFEEKDKERFRKKQHKIEEVIKEERLQREFHAQPLPIANNPVGIPHIKPKQPTNPDPFKFVIDPLNTKAKIQEPEQKWEFHARPPKVLEKEPFKPITGERPPVFPDKPFELHTEERHEKREEFEKKQQEKIADFLEEKRQTEEFREQAERERINKERKEREHKAKPIPQYKLVVIKKGEIPPTKPVSPKFSDRFKK